MDRSIDRLLIIWYSTFVYLVVSMQLRRIQFIVPIGKSSDEESERNSTSLAISNEISDECFDHYSSIKNGKQILTKQINFFRTKIPIIIVQ